MVGCSFATVREAYLKHDWLVILIPYKTKASVCKAYLQERKREESRKEEQKPEKDMLRGIHIYSDKTGV